MPSTILSPKCRHFPFRSPNRKWQHFPASYWLIHTVFTERGFLCMPKTTLKSKILSFPVCLAQQEVVPSISGDNSNYTWRHRQAIWSTCNFCNFLTCHCFNSNCTAFIQWKFEEHEFWVLHHSCRGKFDTFDRIFLLFSMFVWNRPELCLRFDFHLLM